MTITASLKTPTTVKVAWAGGKDWPCQLFRVNAVTGTRTELGTFKKGQSPYLDQPTAGKWRYAMAYLQSDRGISGVIEVNVQPDVKLATPVVTEKLTGPKQATLTWADVANEGRYRIERALEFSEVWIQVGVVAANVTTFVEDNLPNGRWKYAVTSMP